jgi:hypothetical protein
VKEIIRKRAAQPNTNPQPLINPAIWANEATVPDLRFRLPLKLDCLTHSSCFRDCWKIRAAEPSFSHFDDADNGARKRVSIRRSKGKRNSAYTVWPMPSCGILRDISSIG